MVCAGTSAVMVCMHEEGKLDLHTPFVHEGIVGTQFIGELVGSTRVSKWLHLGAS